MMDATALELNFRKSLTKYLIDSLPEVNFMFDWSAADPDVRSKTMTQWIVVDLKKFERGHLSEAWVDFFVSTRQDMDSWDNSQLADTLVAIFFDDTKTDGLARIPLYDGGVTPWVQVGAILAQELFEFPPRYVIEDETKVKIVSARFRWASKI